MTECEEITSAFGALEITEPLTKNQTEAKTHDLLVQLTLDEKIGLMDGDPPFWSGMVDMASDGYQHHVQAACPAGDTRLRKSSTLSNTPKLPLETSSDVIP